MNTTTNGNATHPFEIAGLGKAPFRFVGAYVSKFQAVPGDPSCPIQPGTSCDYCAAGIMTVCVIRSSDGREFKVGCDCVLKVGDKGLARKVSAEVAKRRTESAHARADKRIAEAVAELPAVADKLRAQPHRNAWQAENGLTMLDCVEWLLANAGRKGKLEAAKIVEAAR